MASRQQTPTLCDVLNRSSAPFTSYEVHQRDVHQMPADAHTEDIQEACAYRTMYCLAFGCVVYPNALRTHVGGSKDPFSSSTVYQASTVGTVIFDDWKNPANVSI